MRATLTSSLALSSSTRHWRTWCLVVAIMASISFVLLRSCASLDTGTVSFDAPSYTRTVPWPPSQLSMTSSLLWLTLMASTLLLPCCQVSAPCSSTRTYLYSTTLDWLSSTAARHTFPSVHDMTGAWATSQPPSVPSLPTIFRLCPKLVAYLILNSTTLKQPAPSPPPMSSRGEGPWLLLVSGWESEWSCCCWWSQPAALWSQDCACWWVGAVSHDCREPRVCCRL
mmetsp:Transcript_33446/g.86757  ORF Transcript_33446/g.86757 Transcript_33446/m.86757 type:complete len:226 (+) Transcript_33446:288-965(+)